MGSAILSKIRKFTGLPRWLTGNESACSLGDGQDMDLISGSGRSPGVGNSNTLQNFCLENPMDREVWRATVHRVTKPNITESTHTQNI